MALNNIFKHHLQNVKILCTDGSTKYLGFLDDVENFETFERDLEASGFSFYKRSSNNKKGKIMFSSVSKTRNSGINIPFFSFPFLPIKNTYLRCSQGEKHPIKQELSTDDPTPKKRRVSKQPSKKVDCMASMSVRCVRVFNEDRYKLNKPNLRVCAEKTRIIKKLNKDLSSANPPTGVFRYFVAISAAEEHNHTIEFSNQNQRLHIQLKNEIYSYVKNNPCSVKTMKLHLNEVVRTMFDGSNCPSPSQSNRCYYPNDEIIRFHMQQGLFKMKKITYDQEVLENSIKTWTAEYPTDTFFFRPYKAPSEDSVDVDFFEEQPLSTLLFCHQTEWQRHLLSRYGNTISLLDSIYKTCNYSLPLFFLVVKTNSGYCVVGTFVVHRESRILIDEALAQFKQWNPAWLPKYFVTTEFSEAEINALEQTFPECLVYLCAFNRELAWSRWLGKHGNVKKKAVVPLMTLWQNIAASRTQEEYQARLGEMYESDDYLKNELAQTYFSQEWLPIYRRWVEAFHAKDFLYKVNTNNDVESQNNVLKHAYLTQQTIGKTLTGILRVILEYFLPDVIQNYSMCNAQINPEDKDYYDSLPIFLRDRPIAFIEKVMSNYEMGKEYDISNITYLGDGVFMVRNEMSVDNLDTVDFSQASCSCLDFRQWRLPCKHMCAVFACTDWGFDKLPSWYQGNPYITLDLQYSAVPPVQGESLENATDSQSGSDGDGQGGSDGDDPGGSDGDDHQEEGMEDELDHIIWGGEEDAEEVDIKKTLEKARADLALIVGSTYLNHNATNAVRLAKCVEKLKKTVETFSSEDALKKSIKSIHKKYWTSPST